MSACLVVSPPGRHSTNITRYSQTPLSFFERCLDLPRYTTLRCLGLIMAETLGAHPRRDEVEITPERFAELFSVTKESVHDALAELEQMGMIQVRIEDRGSRANGKGEKRGAKFFSLRPEYVQEARDAGRQKIPGRCPDCKTIGLFSSEFIPLPHSALRKLGGCVPSAVFRAVMVVCRYTLKWNKDARCIDVDPQELNLDDFTRCTGLEKREITDALTKAVQLGLIAREMRSGRPSLFWAIPQNFSALKVRPQREVLQPIERKAKQEQSKPSEKPSKPAITHANESGSYFFGKCPNCNHFVDVEPVSEEEMRAAQPEPPAELEKRPPRAGPTRETKDGMAGAWDVLRKWHGPKKTILKA